MLNELAKYPCILIQTKANALSLLADILQHYKDVKSVTIVTQNSFYSSLCSHATIYNTEDSNKTLNMIYNNHYSKIREVGLITRFADDASKTTAPQRESIIIIDNIKESKIIKELMINNQQLGIILILVSDHLLTSNSWINDPTIMQNLTLFIDPELITNEQQHEMYSNWNIQNILHAGNTQNIPKNTFLLKNGIGGLTKVYYPSTTCTKKEQPCIIL